MYVPFEEMPDQSKVWLYPSANFLEEGLKSNIDNELKVFVREWLSHQREVKGSSEIMVNGIICLAADQAEFDVSGCSIDSSYRFVKDLEKKYHLSLFERDLVFYKTADGDIEMTKIYDLESIFNQGEISEETEIFNLQAQTVGQVRNAWVAIKDTPYSRFLPKEKV